MWSNIDSADADDAMIATSITRLQGLSAQWHPANAVNMQQLLDGDVFAT